MKIETYNEIRTYLATIIENTEYMNKVYAVGGCCRDIIMNNPIKDIDLVVALPDGGIKFAEWLEDNGFLNGHVVKFTSFGTAMFKLAKFPDIELEAVQTRNEEYINRDSRKPSTCYGTIKEDCMRRDLTINAIYYNISKNTYEDVCGTSLEDIKNHIIRTPDDPNITYADDPLRILRCIRFATRFNWQIEEKTFKGMQDNVYRLKIVSFERINVEMQKILMHENFAYGMELLHKLHAMNYVVPEFYLNTNVDTYVKEKDPIFWLKDKTLEKCYFFLTKNIKRNVLYNIKFPKDFIMTVEKYKRLFTKWDPILIAMSEVSDGNIKHIVRELQYECKDRNTLKEFCDIMYAFYKVKNLNTYAIVNIYDISKEIEKDGEDMFNYKLPINGDDVMALGIPPGKEIRNILESLTKSAFINRNIDKDYCVNYIKGCRK